MTSSKFWKWVILTITPFLLVYMCSLCFGKNIVESIKSPIPNLKGEAEIKSQLNTPSINAIFSQDHKWVATLSAKKIKTIIFTGDVIPARTVNVQVLNNNDFNWPYLKTAEITRNADLTVANLESPLVKNCPVTNEGMIFCGNIGNAKGLAYAGIDMVSVANNHFANYGDVGIKDSIESLSQENIEIFGLETPVVKTINNTRFGFLAYNDIEKEQPGISNVNEEKIKKEIMQLKEISDFVIVAFHWGAEYQTYPDQKQKVLAHFAVDNGADLIIGNHPHWIQPIETYKNKIITYAHGNFVFDQMWSRETQLGVIGKYTFYDNKLIDIEYFPIRIENYGQPQILEEKEALSILNSLKEKSIILNNPQ